MHVREEAALGSWRGTAASAEGATMKIDIVTFDFHGLAVPDGAGQLKEDRAALIAAAVLGKIKMEGAA